MIERMCNISAKLYHSIGNYGRPNDCICADRAARTDAERYFRCDGEILDLLEKIVDEAIESKTVFLDANARDADEGDA